MFRKSFRGREDDRGFGLVPSPLLPLQLLQPAARLHLRVRRARQQDLLQSLLRKDEVGQLVHYKVQRIFSQSFVTLLKLKTFHISSSSEEFEQEFA